MIAEAHGPELGSIVGDPDVRKVVIQNPGQQCIPGLLSGVPYCSGEVHPLDSKVTFAVALDP